MQSGMAAQSNYAKITILCLKRNVKGRVDDPDHMVDDSLQMVERDFSYYVCNMPQEKNHPVEDYVVREK